MLLRYAKACSSFSIVQKYQMSCMKVHTHLYTYADISSVWPRPNPKESSLSLLHFSIGLIVSVIIERGGLCAYICDIVCLYPEIKGDFTNTLENHRNILFLTIFYCWSSSPGRVKNFHFSIPSRWPPLWSSGQSSWLQIRRPGFDSRDYQKKKCSGSGTGCTQPREYKLRSYLIEK
jgi:hypothetical protein